MGRGGEIRPGLADRLAARVPEIEQTILARVRSVSDPAAAIDPAYVEGLRAAVSAAVEYGLSGVTGRAVDAVRIPPDVLNQARRAARNRVSLDTVLRRYVAGHTLLADHMLREAETADVREAAELKRLASAQAALFDRLIEAVVAEYRSESEGMRASSRQQHRLNVVRKMLAGELVDASELDYDFEAWHLAAVVLGPGGEELIRQQAAAIDRLLLTVPLGGEAFWAWFCAHRPPGPGDYDLLMDLRLPRGVSLALGESGQGLSGWRLSHRQAMAAVAVASRQPGRAVRYGEVALLASTLQDEVLSRSLEDLFLAPLADSEGGEDLYETLRAYFAADCNVSSAAAALSINRHTVAKRLGVVEERLGRPVGACVPELEIALRLRDLTECERQGESVPPGPHHIALSGPRP